jgi:hypothetical protein
VLFQLGGRLTTKFGLERVDLLDERVVLSEATAGPCKAEIGLSEEVFGLELDGSLTTKFGLEEFDLLDEQVDRSESGFGPFDIEVDLLEEVLGLFNAGIILFALGGSLTTKFGLEWSDLEE